MQYLVTDHPLCRPRQEQVRASMGHGLGTYKLQVRVGGFSVVLGDRERRGQYSFARRAARSCFGFETTMEKVESSICPALRSEEKEKGFRLGQATSSGGF